MPPLAALSRRALVAAAAVAAVAPGTEARKRRRKPKPKPEPLAFVAIAVQGVSNFVSGSDRAFVWTYQARLQHPASGLLQNLNDVTTGVAIAASQEQTRQQIASGARSLARSFLLDAGHDVPLDRIAVVLL